MDGRRGLCGAKGRAAAGPKVPAPESTERRKTSGTELSATSAHHRRSPFRTNGIPSPILNPPTRPSICPGPPSADPADAIRRSPGMSQNTQLAAAAAAVVVLAVRRATSVRWATTPPGAPRPWHARLLLRRRAPSPNVACEESGAPWVPVGPPCQVSTASGSEDRTCCTALLFGQVTVEAECGQNGWMDTQRAAHAWRDASAPTRLLIACTRLFP